MSQNGDPIQLDALGYPLASLVGSSHDNGLWIYDQQNFELLRLNRNLEVEQRTGNLSQLLGIALQPNFIMEKDDRLFLNNPATGILVFDIYGTYSKTIPVKDLKTFQVIEDKILYFQSPTISMWDLPTAEISAFDDPHDTAAVDMRMEKNAFFVLTKQQLEIYNKQ